MSRNRHALFQKVTARIMQLVKPNKIWLTKVEAFSGSPFTPLEVREVFSPGQPKFSLRRHAVHTIADPFLFVHQERLWLFAEEQRYGCLGEIIAYSTSDLKEWKCHGIILREPFHLSYPQVFAHQGRCWMLPEVAQSGAVWLYSTDDFPLNWQKAVCLISLPLLDPTLIEIKGNFYIFATDPEGWLRLYTALELTGPYREHPSSPVTRDPRYSRCGGPIISEADGRMYRLAQDGAESYGKGLHTMRILTLSPTEYKESLAHEDLLPRDKSSRRFGVHQLSLAQFHGIQIRATDGLGPDLAINNLRRFVWGLLMRIKFFR